MKQLLITLSLILQSILSIGQNKAVQIDTFYSSNNFGSFYLLIGSDSNFYVSINNCTDAIISKGKWQTKKEKLFLFPDKIDELTIKPDIESNIVVNDTVVTIEVLDCLKEPIPGYIITFFDKNLKEQAFETNNNGKIILPKNTYIGYLTKDDFKNIKFPTELTSVLRFIWDKYSRISLTLNYPSYMLKQREEVQITEYKKETWVKSKDGMYLLSNPKFLLKKPK